MRTSNTGFFGPGDPIMRRGLSGLGAMVMGDMVFGGGDPAYTAPMDPNPSSVTPWYTDPKTITALNSELLFGANLFRGLTNQAPLAASQYAPQVAVGLNAETSRMLLLGGAGILAFMMLKGGKRKKRR